LYWSVKDKDKEYRGKFRGFYLDDPDNPVIVKTGAKYVAAGIASTAALVYATLA